MPLDSHVGTHVSAHIDSHGGVPTLTRYRELLEGAVPMTVEGSVREVVGLLADIDGIPGRLGEMCQIEQPNGEYVEAEVVGFRGERTLVMPLGDLHG
ncbi:MAG: hypothetical protein WD942_03900, partial [Dehalococcoidia bacterium]